MIENYTVECATCGDDILQHDEENISINGDRICDLCWELEVPEVQE